VDAIFSLKPQDVIPPGSKASPTLRPEVRQKNVSRKLLRYQQNAEKNVSLASTSCWDISPQSILAELTDLITSSGKSAPHFCHQINSTSLHFTSTQLLYTSSQLEKAKLAQREFKSLGAKWDSVNTRSVMLNLKAFLIRYYASKLISVLNQVIRHRRETEWNRSFCTSPIVKRLKHLIGDREVLDLILTLDVINMIWRPDLLLIGMEIPHVLRSLWHAMTVSGKQYTVLIEKLSKVKGPALCSQ
jgi:hypothetical protein